MIYLIIPTYNERLNIKPLLLKILALKIEKLKILVVDDSSPDGTGEIVKELARQYPQIQLLVNQGKQGLGRAYLKAFFFLQKKKDLEYVLTMDADFSHQPQYIPLLLNTLQKFDYVVGSRHIPGAILDYPWPRRFLSIIGVNVARYWLGLQVHDCTSAFRAFNKDVLRFLTQVSFSNFVDGYIFQIEMNYFIQKQGFRIGEIPIIFHDRRWGQSKLSFSREILKGIFSLIRLKLKNWGSF